MTFTPLEAFVWLYSLLSVANSAVCALPTPRNAYSFYGWLYSFLHGLISIADRKFAERFHTDAPETSENNNTPNT